MKKASIILFIIVCLSFMVSVSFASTASMRPLATNVWEKPDITVNTDQSENWMLYAPAVTDASQKKYHMNEKTDQAQPCANLSESMSSVNEPVMVNNTGVVNHRPLALYQNKVEFSYYYKSHLEKMWRQDRAVVHITSICGVQTNHKIPISAPTNLL